MTGRNRLQRSIYDLALVAVQKHEMAGVFLFAFRHFAPLLRRLPVPHSEVCSSNFRTLYLNDGARCAHAILIFLVLSRREHVFCLYFIKRTNK